MTIKISISAGNAINSKWLGGGGEPIENPKPSSFFWFLQFTLNNVENSKDYKYIKLNGYASLSNNIANKGIICKTATVTI